MPRVVHQAAKAPAARVGFACIGVSDLGGEKLDDPFGRLRIGRKERRQRHADFLSCCR